MDLTLEPGLGALMLLAAGPALVSLGFLRRIVRTLQAGRRLEALYRERLARWRRAAGA
jgi:hypothetical protein